MKRCDETVTLYNARVDPATRTEVYAPTVLRGVSWRCETAAKVAEGGLKAANVFALRIPVEADMGGKAYVEPADYRRAEDVSGLWTLGKGDVIVRGEVSENGQTPVRLRARFGAERVMTVLGVTDNRGAPNGRHWKVIGA